jgi:hypothetical protein
MSFDTLAEFKAFIVDFLFNDTEASIANARIEFRIFDTVQSSGEGFMAGGLNLYSGLGAKDKYRAHLGHEQLTALVKTLRGLRYKVKLDTLFWKQPSASLSRNQL